MQFHAQWKPIVNHFVPYYVYEHEKPHKIIQKNLDGVSKNFWIV